MNGGVLLISNAVDLAVKLIEWSRSLPLISRKCQQRPKGKSSGWLAQLSQPKANLLMAKLPANRFIIQLEMDLLGTDLLSTNTSSKTTPRNSEKQEVQVRLIVARKRGFWAVGNRQAHNRAAGISRPAWWGSSFDQNVA